MFVFLTVLMGSLPGIIRPFKGAPSGIILQLAQLWIVILAGIKPICLRTDYKTSIWKIPVLFGINATLLYRMNNLVSAPLLFRIMWNMCYMATIELYGYQALAEQCSLFLKSEVILRQSKATKKANTKFQLELSSRSTKNQMQFGSTTKNFWRF